jgi:cell wall-associated NlpC family hydrolase
MKVAMLSLRSLFFFLIACLVFTSCKSRKIITDASSARGKELSGTLEQRYSTLLGVREKDIKDQRLYKFIDSWMGAPHRLGGMDKGGIDCSGFTTILQKEVFSRSVARTAREMADQVKRLYEEDLKEGDLVFFNFGGQPFNHVGVYLHNNKFVHVSTSKGVIISDLKDPWYYKYFSRCGSVK